MVLLAGSQSLSCWIQPVLQSAQQRHQVRTDTHARTHTHTVVVFLVNAFMCLLCRDLFIICPTLQMARHWAENRASVFLYHQPASSAHDRCAVSTSTLNINVHPSPLTQNILERRAELYR